MADLVSVGSIVAFFAVAALLVRGCDRIIGPDAAAARAATPEAETVQERAA